ncbi:hypothetical protein EV421DRAFT_1742337 [Armillaria borealis]|uniref:Uncharacterized protein n=1 Tax=Armillaria borealis TaxID=47425 RepID=A0AA39MG88_9AGAR|nr:hypothetical protein EV421DRAFT_1742337 [Armillaria borealis]
MWARHIEKLQGEGALSRLLVVWKPRLSKILILGTISASRVTLLNQPANRYSDHAKLKPSDQILSLSMEDGDCHFPSNLLVVLRVSDLNLQTPVSALPAEQYTGFNASWPAGVKHTLPIFEIDYEINPPKIYVGNNEPRAVAPNRPAADKNRASKSYGKVHPNRRSTRV